MKLKDWSKNLVNFILILLISLKDLEGWNYDAKIGLWFWASIFVLKKINFMKAFLSNILMSDYDHREVFLNISKKSVSIWLDNQTTCP